MPKDVLRISDRPGAQPNQRILELEGPLVLTTMFEFQSLVRADQSQTLIIDFANVPYADSAGIGALVGGGTTFFFVTDGVVSALRQAKDAARGKDVRVGGGVATIRQCLAAGAVD